MKNAAEVRRGAYGGGATGGIYEKRLRRGILGGWAWRHMQRRGCAGAGIITPDQESGTSQGWAAAQGHSKRVVAGYDGELHNTT